MVFELLKLDIPVTDKAFNSIYPTRIRRIAGKHWTPVSVAKVTSDFLAEKPGTRVLDIGSGAGKFCLVGAVHTRGHFTGIEQREDLVDLSVRLSTTFHIPNVRFIHSNIISMPFRAYDAFYFFNSFHENLEPDDRIDNKVHLHQGLYHRYSMYVIEQLSTLPPGTRLATYHSIDNIVPFSYTLVDVCFNGLLKLWEKIY